MYVHMYVYREQCVSLCLDDGVCLYDGVCTVEPVTRHFVLNREAIILILIDSVYIMVLFCRRFGDSFISCLCYPSPSPSPPLPSPPHMQLL